MSKLISASETTTCISLGCITVLFCLYILDTATGTTYMVACSANMCTQIVELCESFLFSMLLYTSGVISISWHILSMICNAYFQTESMVHVHMCPFS